MIRPALPYCGHNWALLCSLYGHAGTHTGCWECISFVQSRHICLCLFALSESLTLYLSNSLALCSLNLYLSLPYILLHPVSSFLLAFSMCIFLALYYQNSLCSHSLSLYMSLYVSLTFYFLPTKSLSLLPSLFFTLSLSLFYPFHLCLYCLSWSLPRKSHTHSSAN